MPSKKEARPLTFTFVIYLCFYAFALLGTFCCTVTCVLEFIRRRSPDLQLQPADQTELIISILLTIMFYVAALTTKILLEEKT